MTASFKVADIPFGTGPVPKLEGFPEGKTRIRQRQYDTARVFVRNESGIVEFVPQRVDGHWEPLLEVARNLTVPPEITH